MQSPDRHPVTGAPYQRKLCGKAMNLRNRKHSTVWTLWEEALGMGAWGVGMQANDSALDAIASCGDGTKPNMNATEVQELIYGIKEQGMNGNDYILGLAEHLLDAGADLSLVRVEVLARIIEEQDESHLADWRSAPERNAALDRFRLRLAGKTVDPEAIARDNEGLFSKINRSESL